LPFYHPQPPARIEVRVATSRITPLCASRFSSDSAELQTFAVIELGGDSSVQDGSPLCLDDPKFNGRDYLNVTVQSNFTWSKALGTGSSIQATITSTVADPSTSATAMATSRGIAHSCTTCSWSTSLLSIKDSMASSDVCSGAGRSRRFSPPAAACPWPFSPRTPANSHLAKRIAAATSSPMQP
jgi:hypothetical protein